MTGCTIGAGSDDRDHGCPPPPQPSVAATAEAGEKPVLDRYYQCLTDAALDYEDSREAADIVARAVVHKCRPLFVEAALTLRTEKSADARASGLHPDDADGFENRFRAYSLDYALTRVVAMRAWKND